MKLVRLRRRPIPETTTLLGRPHGGGQHIDEAQRRVSFVESNAEPLSSKRGKLNTMQTFDGRQEPEESRIWIGIVVGWPWGDFVWGEPRRQGQAEQ